MFKFRQMLMILILFLTLGSVPAGLLGEGIEESEGQISVEDALGRRVTLIDVPSRIVLAGRATIMLTDALYLFDGVDERVIAVGVTDQGLGDFFEVVDADPEAKVRLGKSAGPEEILARRPDLVILKSYMRDSLGRGIETAGVPVLYLDLETPAQYTRDIATLGTILKQEERASEINDMFASRRAELRSRLADAVPVRTLMLQVSRKDGNYNFSVAPRGWIQSDQVDLAGGEAVWYGAATGSGWNQVQFEQIALWNPEAVVLIDYRGSAADAAEALSADPLWGELDAVASGRLYGMPADFYSWGQPDTRWILGAQWLAYALHPERFSTSFSERVYGFFRDFYGLEEAVVREKLMPRLEGELF